MAAPLLIPLLQRLLMWFGTKLILAFGLSFITYKGFETGLNAMRGIVSNHFAGVPADTYQLLMMMGIGKALGIIFGAYAFKAALSATSRLVAGRKS